MITGVDISSFQPNYKPKAGQDFIFVKATEGTTYVNPEHADQVAAGRKKGLVVGHYHYLHHGNIKAQAKYFLQHAAPEADEPLWLDWEHAGCTESDKNMFMAEVERLAPHNRDGLYTMISWWNASNKKAGDGLWIADPSHHTPAIKEDWLIHQYDWTPLDLNRAQFKSRKAMAAWAASKNSAPVTTHKARPGAKVTTKKGTPLPDDVVWGDRAKVKFRGGYTCSCATQVIGLAEALLIEQSVIKECLDFWQFGYRTDVAASAGTHSKGGVSDAKQHTDAIAKMIRQCGGFGWERDESPAHGAMSPRHFHFGVVGCPHMAGDANAQEADYKAGRNGLANKAADYGPKVSPIRTFKQALEAFTIKISVPEGDDLDMAERFRYIRTDPHGFAKANAFDWLRIDNKAHVSVAYGPTNIVSGYVHLVVSGLTEKESLTLFPAAYDVKGSKSSVRSSDSASAVRVTGEASGWVRTRVPFEWVLGAKGKGFDYRALRFRIKSSTTKARLERVEICGWEVKG